MKCIYSLHFNNDKSISMIKFEYNGVNHICIHRDYYNIKREKRKCKIKASALRECIHISSPNTSNIVYCTMIRNLRNVSVT